MEPEKCNIKSIVGYLDLYASEVGEKTAYTFLEDGEDLKQEISYWDLCLQSKRIAKVLIDLGLSKKPILLLFPSGIDFIVAFYACQYAKAIAIPLYPPRGSKHMERLSFILKDAKAKAILTTTKFESRIRKDLNNLSCQSVDILNLNNLKTPSDTLISYDHELSDISFIQYTSGSTGNTKGVIVTNRNILFNEGMIRLSTGLNQKAVIFSWLPFYHDMGLIGCVIFNVFLGATCILMTPFHFIQKPSRWLKAISKYSVNLSGAPNFAFDLCVEKISDEELEDVCLDSWKVVFNGSEPIRASTLERFYNRFRKFQLKQSAIFPCYGLAEATLMVSGGTSKPIYYTITVRKDALQRGRLIECIDGQSLVSSGRIVPGGEVKIVDPQSYCEVSPGNIGEIWIKGEHVTQGYWGKDEKMFYSIKDLSGESRINEGGYLRTGDLGTLYNNHLFVTGRIKELVIFRGRNFYPTDIEQIVSKSHRSLVSNGSAAFAHSIDDVEHLIVFQEVGRQYIQHLPTDEIFNNIKKSLLEELGIDVYDVVLLKPLGLPRTSSGKIKRSFCKHLYEEKSVEQLASYQNSKNNIPTLRFGKKSNENKPIKAGSKDEIKLRIISKIESLTGNVIEDYFISNNILSFGIDSIKMMDFVSWVYDDYGVRVDIVQLLSGMSLKCLVDELYSLKPLIDVNPDVKPYDQMKASVVQRNIWLTEQANISEESNNIGVCFKTKQNLNIENWNNALLVLINRHESLRTQFQFVKGELYYSVKNRINEINVEEYNAQNYDIGMELLSNSIKAKFDLHSSPLIRVCIVNVNHELNLVGLMFHHIISDGVSINKFFNEFIKLLNGEDLPSQNEKIEFQDFIRLEQQGGSDKHTSNKPYLLNKFDKDSVGAINLPVCGNKKIRKRSAISFQIDKTPIVELCKKENVTPFALFTAIYHLLISKCSGNNNVLTVTPVNRRIADYRFNDLLGCFVNLIYIASNYQPEISFTEYLKHIKSEFDLSFRYYFDPYPNQLEAILGEVGSRNIFRQFMFSYHSFGEEDALQPLLTNFDDEIDFGAIQVQGLPFPLQPQIFEISFDIIEGRDNYQCWLDYQTDLYSSYFMSMYVDNFKRMLDQILLTTHEKLHALNLSMELVEFLKLYTNSEEEKSISMKNQDIIHLLRELTELNVKTIVENGDIKLSGKIKDINSDLLKRLHNNKSELVELLKKTQC